MQELVSISIKARIYLNKISQIEEALVEIIKSTQASRSAMMRISELEDLLRFCERNEREIELANIIVEELKSRKEIASEDIVKVIDVLHECKNELESFVDEMFEEQLVKSMTTKNKYDEYLSTLRNYITEKSSIDKKAKKGEIQRIIYNYPGHYIKSLHTYLQRKFGGEGITYTTVWNYVNELAGDGEIITIGGPQGKFRYCFPNPKKVGDRTSYYDKYFGIVGVVKEKVTKSFISTGQSKKYYDFYIVNSSIKPEIILATSFNAQIPINSGILLRSYGDLKPFRYLQENEGYIFKNGLREMDVLFARRIVKTINSTEKEIWSEPNKAFLAPPPMLI